VQPSQLAVYGFIFFAIHWTKNKETQEQKRRVVGHDIGKRLSLKNQIIS
jgi:hypothetical protein